jgi:1-acyl-sn-glycerol-3-phosphate acyltransferase
MLLTIAWIRSLAAYLFLGVYLTLVGPLAMLVTVMTGWTRHLFVLGRFGAKTMRQMLGIRLDVGGLEHVDNARPSVYCINHASNVDVLIFEVLFPKCPSLRALYKAELSKFPILGRAMQLAGFLPVERAHRDRAIETVDLAVERLREGYSFLLAPEGTRSRTDQLQPFKKGAFVMAIKAQAPVVPVALIGTADAMPRGRAYATPTLVRVRIGAPMPTAGLTVEDRDALAAATRQRIAEMIAGSE